MRPPSRPFPVTKANSLFCDEFKYGPTCLDDSQAVLHVFQTCAMLEYRLALVRVDSAAGHQERQRYLCGPLN